jgi:hypothetical protein
MLSFPTPLLLCREEIYAVWDIPRDVGSLLSSRRLLTKDFIGESDVTVASRGVRGEGTGSKGQGTVVGEESVGLPLQSEVINGFSVKGRV